MNSAEQVVLEGIDVSSRITAASLIKRMKLPDFVYFKATDGVGSPSATIVQSATDVRSIGIARTGAYHFLRVRHGRTQDAREQCREFLELRARAGCDAIEAWLDVEFGEVGSSNRSATHDEVRDAIVTFLDEWQAHTSDAIDIYSSDGEFHAMGIVKISGIEAYGLAKADYRTSATNAPIPPWTSTRFFQYRGTTPYEGVAGGADLTRCYGELALKAPSTDTCP